MKNKRITYIILLTIFSLALVSCGKSSADNTSVLYDELLHKVISGEEMFSDEGEGYTYDEALAPAYALYDIDKDGQKELFITPRKDDEWHTYSVYYIKDGVVTRGRALNGYLPGEDYFTYAFDYFVEAYSFDKNEGFISHWELDYPWVDGIEANTLNYEGQDPREISDEELGALLSGHITEPEDIKWISLTEDFKLND